MATNLKAQLERTTFAPEELISLKSGPEHEEQFKRYTLPQRHRLLEKLRRKDQACVLLTGLPFGMTESNLRQFMCQFGDVIRCIVHRCPRSGKTKGYGYVHFRYSQVADVAAKTMNNYLLMGNIVKCKLIPGKFIKEKSFRPKDPKFHQRMNESIKKVNSLKSVDTEKKALGRRQAVALRQLEKLGGVLQPQELQGLANVPIKDMKKSPKKTTSTQKRAPNHKSKKARGEKSAVKKAKIVKSNRPLLLNQIDDKNSNDEKEESSSQIVPKGNGIPKVIEGKKKRGSSILPKSARAAKVNSKTLANKVKTNATALKSAKKLKK